jgi:hypothetical protein
MRRANISYSQKQYAEGLRHLGKAALAHPLYFIKRVLYELHTSGIVFNGEEPLEFLRQRDVLWPKAESSITSVPA